MYLHYKFGASKLCIYITKWFWSFIFGNIIFQKILYSYDLRARILINPSPIKNFFRPLSYPRKHRLLIHYLGLDKMLFQLKKYILLYWLSKFYISILEFRFLLEITINFTPNWMLQKKLSRAVSRWKILSFDDFGPFLGK